MKRAAPILVVALWMVANGNAETVFKDVQLAGAKGTLTDATLRFDEASKTAVIRAADGQIFTIPYAQIDKVSYEFTKQHRFKQGAGVGLLSPGTGIIVAFTKSKNHWLEIDFHEHDAPAVVVLRLQKRDYQKICEAAKSNTGHDVVVVGQTTAKAIKAGLKN